MDDILKKADELATMLMAHPRYQGLRVARDAVRDDPEAGKALEAYQQQVDKVQKLASQQKPIEPADKHKLADLEQQVTSHDKIRELVRCQADFSELLNNLNRRLFGPLAADQGMEEDDDDDFGDEE